MRRHAEGVAVSAVIPYQGAATRPRPAVDSAGTAMAVSQNFGSVYPLQLGGTTIPGYAALYAVILNLVVTLVLTWVFNAASVATGTDETVALDYTTARA